MNPLKYGQFLKWLTRDKSLEKLYKEGKLFPASEAPIPTKKPEVEGMEAINRFVKDNPRIEQPKEGVIQSAFDTATREAQMGNYPAPKYETFRARYLRNLNKKEDGGMLVKPSADGSRPGYAKDDVTYTRKWAEDRYNTVKDINSLKLNKEKINLKASNFRTGEMRYPDDKGQKYVQQYLDSVQKGYLNNDMSNIPL